MSVLQLLMLGASAFFAFKIYQHIQTLEDDQNIQREDYEPSQDEKDEDYAKAMNTFSPYSAEELVQKADDAYQNEDEQKALAFLSEANLKAPNNAEILFKLGFISAKVGDNTMAIRYYKESLDVDKDDEFVHNSLASVYRAEKEFASAKMHLNDSLSIDDTNALTYYNYGNLMIDMGNEDVAREMYAKAIELDPEFKEAKEELEKLQKD
ncbi:tetratricopeptide repeat protein [Sulfurimonas lithotrophica]|uniref:Tetratricopeptide repeat protein n=1 Tax=Sulfurimonas lithotrophica TaxID=2590022 RepID=A0A5P8NZ73_9BACT|nr:tetratricopeptide repeat protein [Sulfurimonas lithotrophica]QFR48742.1 tetratricopeptide repeat protein [Sulfurimonas lithotrophica]